MTFLNVRGELEKIPNGQQQKPLRKLRKTLTRFVKYLQDYLEKDGFLIAVRSVKVAPEARQSAG